MKQPTSTPPRTSWTTRGRALRRAPVVLVLISVVVVAWVSPAAATTRDHLTTDHFTIPIDYPSSFTCPDGHAVEITRDGFLRVTLHRNSSGTIRRELDEHRVHFEVHSPDTGKGWSSFMHINIRLDFHAGTDIGAPARLTIWGSFFQHVPGIGSDYGIRVFAGTVVGYEEDLPFDDIPVVDFNYDNPLFSTGRHPDFDYCASTS